MCRRLWAIMPVLCVMFAVSSVLEAVSVDEVLLRDGYWELVYMTDFSSDPGWTKNNPSRYYWVSSDSTYYIETVMGCSDYTYVDVGWNGNSFKIAYDVNLSQEQWGSRLGLGLYDPLMDEDNSDYLETHFGHDDGGKEACIRFGYEGLHYAQMYYGDYSLNTWYTFEAVYDKSMNTATLTVTERETGAPFCTIDVLNIGTFVGLTKLGFSMIGSTPYGTAFKGRIDNVSYYNWRDYLTATIDIDPNVLNDKSQGVWVTCYIELPEGYSVDDIDVATVKMTEADGDAFDPPLQAEGPYNIGDYDLDGVPDLMVKFDRQELITQLNEMGILSYVELTVHGELYDETEFEGYDTILFLRKAQSSGHQGRQALQEIPADFMIVSCEPNPFNNGTAITYAIPSVADVTLNIYDANGRLVNVLTDEYLHPGYYTVSWDGVNEHGELLPNGVYFLRFETGEYTATQKLLFVK